MTSPARFLFVICQNGAEAAAKQEILGNHPALRLAFSRPGFLTFKTDAASDGPESSLPEKFTLKSTLARTYGWSLGKLANENAVEMIAEIGGMEELHGCQHLHVWQRDPMIPGKNGFEPGLSPLAQEIGALFAKHEHVESNQILVNSLTKPEEKVFDIVMVEPSQWWFGYHYANSVAGRWPGGVPFVDTSKEVCSRAYFKLQEALLWSGITIGPGDLCAEIGSSPGGACQLLLEMGAGVLGIDPAEMESSVLDHKNFIHIRKRGHEVRKREFADVHWLIADLNLAPNYTIDLISEIVRHEATNIHGVILTLKLSDWSNVESIPAQIGQLKSLGFQVVKVRQLAFNRREYCLVGVKDKFLLRIGKKKKSR